MDASGFRLIGEGIAALIFWLLVLCAVFVPLGLWKAVEIVVWICRHVTVGLA